MGPSHPGRWHELRLLRSPGKLGTGSLLGSTALQYQDGPRHGHPWTPVSQTDRTATGWDLPGDRGTAKCQRDREGDLISWRDMAPVIPFSLSQPPFEPAVEDTPAVGLWADIRGHLGSAPGAAGSAICRDGSESEI